MACISYDLIRNPLVDVTYVLIEFGQAKLREQVADCGVNLAFRFTSKSLYLPQSH